MSYLIVQAQLNTISSIPDVKAQVGEIQALLDSLFATETSIEVIQNTATRLLSNNDFSQQVSVLFQDD